MTVVSAPEALRQLDEIWDWNEQYYSADHADRYIEFLERRIEALSQDHGRGMKVPSRPEFKYFLIRRKSKGHGRIAVYRVTAKQIEILHVFHSAENWQENL